MLIDTELLSEAIDIRRGKRLPNCQRSAAPRHRQSHQILGIAYSDRDVVELRPLLVLGATACGAARSAAQRAGR
ncbi:hypothetical protein [Streptomyces sp. NPDC057287]|uniref:hypothetical protein n=1 Tax=Streptomyces sp. NPDC057287 TaxID=3346086 RepID=UPI00363F5346